MVGKASAFSCISSDDRPQINEKHTYNIVDWKDDIKAAVAAAMSTNGIVFVLNHSQIVHEIIRVILMIAPYGQIPDLFSDDELQVIHRQIMPLAKEAGFTFEEMEDFDTMIEYFEERLKNE